MRPGVTYGFDGEDLDVRFRGDLDKLNFGLIAAGETLADLTGDVGMPIIVTNDDGEDVSAALFEVVNGKLTLRQSLTPSMATLDVGVIRQDCLFYIMERMTTPKR